MPADVVALDEIAVAALDVPELRATIDEVLRQGSPIAVHQRLEELGRAELG